MSADALLDAPEDEVKLTARVRFLADWRIGTGAGVPGGIDRTVRRDADELLVVPGKTLRGVWRDACEIVAAGLDEGHPDGPWARRVRRLFGDQPGVSGEGDPARPPAPRLVDVRTATLGDEVATRLRGRPALLDALAFVKPGVRIDRQTGAAMEDHLRFDEVARGGLDLAAPVVLRLADEADLAERRRLLLALAAGAATLRRVGAGRRRGLGRCAVELEIDGAGTLPAGKVADRLAAELRSEATEEQATRAPAGSGAQAQDDSERQGAQVAGGHLELELRLELVDPVVAPRAVVGNAVRTLDFIPGAYLLAAVTAAVDAVSASGRARAAIADGELVVTPATPEVDGARGRPVPLAFQKTKEGRGFAEQGDVVNSLKEERSDGRQTKGLRDEWLGPFTGDQLPAALEIETRTAIHNTVHDERQRPDLAGVYAYEALPGGTVLRAGVVLLEGIAAEVAPVVDELARLLDREVLLGRAKGDEYGRARLSAAATERSEGEDVGDSTEGRAPAPGDEGEEQGEESTPSRLTLWALSDVLAPDERLRTAPSAAGVVAALQAAVRRAGRALGDEEAQAVALEMAEPGDRPVVALRVRRHESWQASWQLPRPTLVAVRAGSVIVVEICAGAISAAVRRRVELEGIGERRAEGFGRVALDDPLLAARLLSLPPHEGRPASGQKDGGDREAWRAMTRTDSATVIEEAAWRKQIEVAATQLAADPSARRQALTGGEVAVGEVRREADAKRAMSRTQLQALRQAALGVGDLTNAGAAWVGQVRAVENRREAWGDSTLEHLDRLFARPVLDSAVEEAPAWSSLLTAATRAGLPLGALSGDPGQLCLTRPARELMRELWPFAVRSLVAACVQAEVRHAQAEPGDAEQSAASMTSQGAN